MHLDGWAIADTIEIEGEKLALQGAFVRKIFIIKAYVLAFYNQDKYTNYVEAIEGFETRNLRLIVSSDMITGAMLVKGLKDGMARTKYGSFPHIQDRLDEIFTLFANFPVKKGDSVDLYYNQKQGFRAYYQHELKFEESDPDLVKAIFGIWFSEKFDKKYRKALMGW